MIFWLICGLLIVIALAFILPTLLQGKVESSPVDREANIAVYRDQISELEADLKNGVIASELYQQERDALERRLLDDVSASPEKKKPGKTPTVDRGTAYAIAALLPCLAVGMYLYIGSQKSMGARSAAPQTAAMTPPGDPQLSEQQRIEANVAALAKKMQDNPSDVDGWIMLGRSYTNLAKFSEASEAYAKANTLKPNDVDLLTDYAFVLAMKNGRKLAGEPTELLKKALTLDPDNAKALQLSGSAAFEVKDYKQAIAYWEKLLPRAGADTELGQALTQRIAEAKKLAENQ